MARQQACWRAHYQHMCFPPRAGQACANRLYTAWVTGQAGHGRHTKSTQLAHVDNGNVGTEARFDTTGQDPGRLPFGGATAATGVPRHSYVTTTTTSAALSQSQSMQKSPRQPSPLPVAPDIPCCQIIYMDKHPFECASPSQHRHHGPLRNSPAQAARMPTRPRDRRPRLQNTPFIPRPQQLCCIWFPHTPSEPAPATSHTGPGAAAGACNQLHHMDATTPRSHAYMAATRPPRPQKSELRSSATGVCSHRARRGYGRVGSGGRRLSAVTAGWLPCAGARVRRVPREQCREAHAS